MNSLILLISLAAVASAQFFDPTVVKPWIGPFADHINGIAPSDTPEVAQAKQALNRAYTDILAVIPELPAEERYISGPHVQVPITYHHGAQPIHVQPVTSGVVKSFQLAEDIPRAINGETPEVYAARQAHLKAVQEANSRAPAHHSSFGFQPVQTQQYVQPTAQEQFYNHQPIQQYHHQPVQYIQQGSFVPQDTPEVARAKAEHAAALLAAQG